MNKMNNKKCKTETSVADLIKPKKSYLYECHCIRCGGKKVSSRTQEKHTTERYLWKSDDDRKKQENAIMSRKKKNTNFISLVKNCSILYISGTRYDILYTLHFGYISALYIF